MSGALAYCGARSCANQSEQRGRTKTERENRTDPGNRQCGSSNNSCGHARRTSHKSSHIGA